MSREKGDYAETIACEYLKENSFEIIERNFYAKKLGEIDIIAKKNGTYHFIEVKSADNYEVAVNNMTPSKISKIKRSVDFYIQQKKLNQEFEIDALIVVNSEITFLENITI